MVFGLNSERSTVINMKLGHEGKKIGVCMLFTASCFIAAFILIEFHNVYIAVAIAGVLLMISAYLLLSVMLSKKVEEWSKPEQEEEESPSNKEAEFREQIKTCLESIDRTQRAMFAMTKRSLEQYETDISAIESSLEKLAAEQASGIKTLVKYNKENARQLAINERDSLSDLKKGIQDSLGKHAAELEAAVRESIADLSNKITVSSQTLPQETVIAAEAAAAVAEPEAMAVAEESTTEETVPEAEELQLEELQSTEFEEPTEEIILPEPETAETIIKEVPSAPETIELPAEEPVQPITEPITEPISDPNAPLSPDDIAKLFAAAEQAEAPAEETVPPAPEPAKTPAAEPAPAFDPNAPLSPEDIAKLFASMGN